MIDELLKERRKKLEILKEAGVNAYPARAKRTVAIGQALADFGKLSKSAKKVTVTGRIMSLRDQGKLLFLDLRDESGQLQAVLKKDNLKNFPLLKSALDRGDFISVAGPLFKTKTGQKSVEAREVAVLTKSLRPLPSEWYGLEEEELRLRQRYLDLIMNVESRELFKKKTLFWETIRDFLKENGFMEVEASVLENTPGGAEAEPFKTHHNALDTDFYLRISLELPLKRLIAGGYEKVFEIGRVFRNEGIDREHLQDYTQMEWYWAYADYNDGMKFVEKMYKRTVKALFKNSVTEWDGKKIDWKKAWPKVDYVKAFKKETGLDPLTAGVDELFKKAYELKLQPERNLGKGRLIDLIYKKTVRPKLVQPCFLIDPPVDIEPLAKRSERDPRVVERFQVVACGTELGKGFSELNDPLDQRARFEEQMRLRAAGDTEAQQLDEDFLEALEYGMPPTAGFGLSERLFAVLMNKPVREAVLFPLMKPKGK